MPCEERNGNGCREEQGKSMTTPTISAIAPWFGSNRMLAHEVGKLLTGCKWVGVPFAGGMSEVAHITASTIAVNDLHRHVMNLACVVASSAGLKRFVRSLSALPFHPDSLAYAQLHCEEMERGGWDFSKTDAKLSEKWAVNYFVSQWMGRSGNSGTDKEFSGGLPVRWNASGGDSNTRYRSAVKSLAAWSQIMQRCNFTTLDFRVFLAKSKDEIGHGLYCDPPFPNAGEVYQHKFSEQDQRELRDVLRAYKKTKVVIRYYDHPLIRELYPETEWTWHRLIGRKQSNADAPEVLITKRIHDDHTPVFLS